MPGPWRERALQPMTGRALLLLALACAAAAPLPAQALGDPIAWTLRDSLARRTDFVHQVALPAECPAVELWNHLEWQWRRQHREVLADLWRLSEGEPGEAKALRGMREREAREPEVAALYQRCHDASPPAFWYLVVSASGAERRTLDHCREHVDWQHGSYRGTVRQAARWLEGRQRSRARPELAPYVAIAVLLSGQQHNARTMALYRACYRDDPEALRAYVMETAR